MQMEIVTRWLANQLPASSSVEEQASVGSLVPLEKEAYQVGALASAVE